MYLRGLFRVISVTKKEIDGKLYRNINVEDEDGKLFYFGMDNEVLPDLKKYGVFDGQYEVTQYQGATRLKLVAVKPVEEQWDEAL